MKGNVSVPEPLSSSIKCRVLGPKQKWNDTQWNTGQVDFPKIITQKSAFYLILTVSCIIHIETSFNHVHSVCMEPYNGKKFVSTFNGNFTWLHEKKMLAFNVVPV